MSAGIPADGTRSDNSYLPTHAFLPAFLAAEASAPAGTPKGDMDWKAADARKVLR
jgi:hypothetical protein